MGLSVIASGVIISVVFVAVLATMPTMFDSLVSVGESSTKTSDLEDSIIKTDFEITSVTASSGDDIVSFELLNTGEEKVWDWSEFDLFVTYDANIGGTKTRVTEKLTYNDIGLGLVADFNIQRGTFDFGNNEDADTVILAAPVASFGEGGNAFVRLTNTQSASSGTDGNNDNIDDIGVIARLTATDTITFTRLGTGENDDYRFAWEIWEYVGPPGGPNEFIVRLEAEPGTIGNTAVDTLIPNVVDSEKLVPFVTSLSGTRTNNDWDDVTHTTEIIDDVAGNSYVRIQKNSGDGNPNHVVLTVVEFTGSNWIIQNNISHPFTNGGANEIESVAGNADFHQAVSRWANAFIVPSYHAESGQEERSEIGYNVWPGATTDEIRFRLDDDANGVDNNYEIIVHVVENPDISITHCDSITGDCDDTTGGGGDPDIENKDFIPPVANMAETGLIATADNNSGGTAAPRVFWDYRLIDTDTVEFRRSNAGGAGQIAIQVIEFPQLNSPLAVSLWSVFNIKNDFMDPGILNAQETAQVSAQLSNPVFTDGVVIIQIASDRGVQASESKVVV